MTSKPARRPHSIPCSCSEHCECPWWECSPACFTREFNANVSTSESARICGGRYVTRFPGCRCRRYQANYRRTCASCKQPGHRVDVCPTVVYVPGSNGEVKKWADCYNCGAFGHVRSFCPKARSGYWVSYRSPGDDQAKNGMLLTDGPSMGGSGL